MSMSPSGPSILNLALIPYVESLYALDANMCGKVVEFFFLFFVFITTRGFNLLAATFTNNFISIMSKHVHSKTITRQFSLRKLQHYYSHQHCINHNIRNQLIRHRIKHYDNNYHSLTIILRYCNL